MTESVERLRARRRGHRGVATKYVQEAKHILENDDADSSQRERLVSLQKSLQEKLKLLFKLDEDILNSCTTEEIELDIEEAETVNSRITEVIEQCSRAKKATTMPVSSSVERSEVIPPTSDSHHDRSADELDNLSITDEPPTRRVPVVSAFKPKLPKLTLLKFKGDIT